MKIYNSRRHNNSELTHHVGWESEQQSEIAKGKTKNWWKMHSHRPTNTFHYSHSFEIAKTRHIMCTALLLHCDTSKRVLTEFQHFHSANRSDSPSSSLLHSRCWFAKTTQQSYAMKMSCKGWRTKLKGEHCYKSPTIAFSLRLDNGWCASCCCWRWEISKYQWTENCIWNPGKPEISCLLFSMKTV